MVVCTYEDRISASTGLKLLLLSLAHHCPALEVDVTVPTISDGLGDWFGRHTPNVRIRPTKSWAASGWNVKPFKLLELLDEGVSEAIWIDTDIIVHSDFRPLIAGLDDKTIVVGQEFRRSYAEGNRVRTEGWGLKLARALPYTTNSGFVRVTPHHRSFLRRWAELLSTPEYNEAQRRPIPERPIHMLSDQDVLWALLGSSKFAEIPVRYLRCGRDIIQNSGANGYHWIERLQNLWYGLPPLIHFLGKEKPWHFDDPSHGENLKRYAMELSPYVAVARTYERQVETPCNWMTPTTTLARTLAFLTCNHPTLQGLPLALAASVVK